MQRTYIESEYKLVSYETRDYGELYNLKTDPYQTINLYNDPEHLDLRKALEQKYAAHANEKDLVRERNAIA